MQEDFLHYLWRYQIIAPDRLTTTTGERVTVLNPGLLNRHAGPDFTAAKLRIGVTLWAGQVELHLRSSDWYRHNHHTDAAYNNVILHVVYENDQEVYLENGSTIPTIELKGHIPKRIFERYQYLQNNQLSIPCRELVSGVDDLTMAATLSKELTNRLARKTREISGLLEKNGGDWATTFYQLCARCYGLKVNADTFEALARSLPLKVIAKHKDHLLQIEALLFGQAGFLYDELEEGYPDQLKKEYQFLQQKYQLTPLPQHRWKFLRMRPAGFPTLRIAQFAALLHHAHNLFSLLLETRKAEDYLVHFKHPASNYWRTHYRFNSTTKQHGTAPGKQFLNLLVINLITPVLFAYGKHNNQYGYCEKALELLSISTAEKNRIVSAWSSIRYTAESAFDSQALIELTQQKCSKKQCLQCGLGVKILEQAEKIG